MLTQSNARRAVRPLRAPRRRSSLSGVHEEAHRSGHPRTGGRARSSSFEKGPQPGERFFVDRPRLTIGRDPESDIFLNDMTVSRTHAVMELIGATVKVTDAGSLNGTYVNGVLVDTAELCHGDAVQIGTFQMAFFCVPEGGR